MKKVFLSVISSACALVVLVHSAGAVGNGSGTVAGYFTYSSGSTEYFFFSTASLSGAPSCNDTNRFVISSTDPKFKTTVAVILAAYAAGSAVVVKGGGACSVFPNSEDVFNVVIGAIPY